MTRFLAALVVALTLPTGCVSVLSTATDPQPYGGVRLAAEVIGDGSPTLGGVPVLVALDLPLTALLDTLLLPYTLWP